MAAAYSLSVYADPEAFAAAAEPYLLEREAEHCLLLGLLPHLRAGGAPDAYLAVVRAAAGEPVLVAMRTPPYRLIVSEAAPGHAPAAVVAPLAGAVHSSGGVLGAVAPARACAALWEAATGGVARLSQAERIYTCSNVVAPRGVAGGMRRAGPELSETLVAWRLAFLAEAAPGDPRQTPEAALEAVTRDLAATAGGLWVWEIAGRPVSMAGARGPTRNGIRIGPVYTPPEQRGNGYAGALTAALTQHLLDGGRRHVTLFTDLANPTSNHIYQAVGYVPVVDQDVYDFA